jgi:hypothetical protein
MHICICFKVLWSIYRYGPLLIHTKPNCEAYVIGLIALAQGQPCFRSKFVKELDQGLTSNNDSTPSSCMVWSRWEQYWLIKKAMLAVDATLVRSALAYRLSTIVQNVALTLTAFVIAFTLSWKLTLVVAACFPRLITEVNLIKPLWVLSCCML